MKEQNKPEATGGKQGFFKKWGLVMVLSLALAIIIIDTTLLNVSLSTIIKELNSNIQEIQWVITLYSLIIAALTITGGRLGDIFGRKRMFVLGAIIFAIGSFVASISTNAAGMILGEAVIEGIGAVLMLPATASLLISNYKGHDRAIAFGIWGGIAAASSAIGPVIGGFLTTNYSWRWGFRINVVVGALVVLGSFIIKEFRDTEEKPGIDWMGVLLSALGMLFVTFGIIEASTYGWWQAKSVFMLGDTAINIIPGISITVPSIILGLVLIVVFILWEKRQERLKLTPLVSLELFKNKRFTAGLITTLVMALGQTGLIFALPVFFQTVRGLDAFHTGLALLPLSISLLFAAPISASLSRKFYPKTLIVVGLIVNALAYVVLVLTINVNATPADFIPGLVLFGAGFGMIISVINNITLSAVSVQEAGEASGVNNTARQLGATLGSAIIGSVLLTTLTTSLIGGVNSSQVIPSAFKDQVSKTITEQSSSIEFGGPTQFSNQIPAAITTEITNISHQASVDGNKAALELGLLFSLAAILAAMRLPKEHNVEKGISAAAH